MTSNQNQSISEKAMQIYSERLQNKLEASHMGQFVAIEPESGDHFVAVSFSHAVADARKAYPDRISFVIRIGHKAALHIGGMVN